MSQFSVLHVAALYRAKQTRFKNKKKVPSEDGGETTIYEYSDAQVARRNSDKAKRVQKLREARKTLVTQVKKDLKSKDLKTRLTALAVALIDKTYERVGNDGSAKDGHFGVTVWQAKHVSFSGNKATISYVGKSGVKQSKTVNDAAAIKVLKEALQGKSGTDDVFTCKAKGGEVSVIADDVNDYLPEGITAKDLRGLHANEEMLTSLKEIRSKGPKLPSDHKKREKILKEEFSRALDQAAEVVGHEASTLSSQYLVPALETAYMKDGTVIQKFDGKTASMCEPLQKEGALVGTDTGTIWAIAPEQLRNLMEDKKFQEAWAPQDYEVLGKAVRQYGGATFGTGGDGKFDLKIVPGKQYYDEKGYLRPYASEGFQKFLEKRRGEPLSWLQKEVSTKLAQTLPAVVKEATKSEAEKEDEQARKMLRKEPKKKPPRYDLRKKRLDNGDDDTDEGTADDDKDLSLNYKRVAFRFAQNKRVASRYIQSRDLAKTPEAAKKLLERYKKKSPNTTKTWQDFFEEPEAKAKKDDEPTEERAKGEEEEPTPEKPKEKPADDKVKPEEEEAAKEKEHQKAVKNSIKEVRESLKAIPGAALPKDVSDAVKSVLAEMTPEQLQEFTAVIKDRSTQARDFPIDGKDAIGKADKKLEELSGYKFDAELDPTRLAEAVVERAHADAIKKKEKSKLTGRQKQISEQMTSLESAVQRMLGDESYVMPSSIKKTIQAQMDELDEEKFESLRQSIESELEDLEKSDDMDSDEALEVARETLDEYEESVDAMTDMDALGGQLANAIRSKRVVERFDQRKKQEVKATKRAINNTARIFGEKAVPKGVKDVLVPALDKLNLDQKQAYMDLLASESQKIKSQITTDPESGDQSIPPDLMLEATQTLALDDYGKTPEEIAKNVAMAMAAQSLIANPFNLAGKEVGAEKLDQAGLTRRGTLSYEKYKDLPHEMRIAAAKKVQSRLEDIDPESEEAQELNKILDGITLAALTAKRGKDDKIPQIPGREVNVGFAEMARAMADDGKIQLLLGPVENFYSSAGQGAVESAMSHMEDEALAKSVETTMPEIARELMKEDLTTERKGVLRRAIVQLSVDNMAVIDQMIASRLQESGDENFDDPEYRAEFTTKWRQALSPDWWKDMMRRWLNTGDTNEQSFSTPATSGVPGVSTPGTGGREATLNSPDMDPVTGMRLEVMREQEKFLSKEVGGATNSHKDRVVQRFLETGNPKFLRADPESPQDEFETALDKKEGCFSRFSPDSAHVLTAGQPSVSAGRHQFTLERENPMTQPLTKEAALTAKKIADSLDITANLVQNNLQLLAAVDIPQKIGGDFAYRCDLLSDAIDKVFKAAEDPQIKAAYEQGSGQGTSPGSDDNTNAGPPQPFNPKVIGEQDATPPMTQADEPYMKKNFIQEEFNELRNFQEKGLFSNAKAASATMSKMIAKLQAMQTLMDQGEAAAE